MTRIGPFQLEEKLGEGGTAEVWQATHVELRAAVAVKIETGPNATDPVFVNAIHREARAMARLDHPCVMEVLDYGQVAEPDLSDTIAMGAPYIVMRVARGGSLANVRQARDWDHLRAVLLDLLDALAHAHARGVIHRDIKPSNVLLLRRTPDASSPLALTDFGMVHAESSPTPERATTTGTPHYMAPEQVLGELRQLGPWTDLYALGCLAFRLMTGRPPFAGLHTEPQAVMRAQLITPAPRPESPFAVPSEFTAWLMTLLAKNPADRFQRAADAARVLLQLQDPEQPPEAAFFPRRATHPGRSTGVLPAPDASAIEPRTRTNQSARSRIRVAPFPLDWRRKAPVDLRPAKPGLGLSLFGLRDIRVVGHESQRDALWGELVRVHDERRPRAVVLSGPAGRGKSRLARWLSERGHEVGGVISMRAQHSSHRAPTSALAELARRQLQTEGLRRREIIDLLLERLPGPDSPVGFSDGDLNAFVEMVASEPAEPSDREVPRAHFHNPSERYLLLEKLVRWLADERPVLIWLDDVQWGHDSIEFVDFVLERACELPVLFVLTARDDLLGKADKARAALERVLQRPAADQVTVSPLSTAAHAELVRSLLRFRPVLVDRLASATDGNPLFAVQMAQTLVGRGELRPTPTGFELRPDADGSLPEDIQRLWIGRLDALVKSVAPAAEAMKLREQGSFAHRPMTPALAPKTAEDDVRFSLEIAAALGPNVRYGEWYAACARIGVVVPRALLDTMAKAGLAELSRERWAFSHGMLHESVDRQARDAGRWRAQHRACAAMLLKRYGARTRGVQARRAHHLLAAESWDQALGPLLHAAEELRRTSDFDDALVLLAQYDGALSSMGLRRGDARRSECLAARARILMEQAQLAAAAKVVDEVEMLTRMLGQELLLGRALWVRGGLANRAGDLAGAEKAYLEGLRYFEGVDEGWSARCLHGAANACLWRGDLENALERYTRALTHFGRSTETEEHGFCLLGMATVHRRSGALELAEQSAGEALAHFESAGTRYGMAVALNELGEQARHAEALEVAEERYRTALSLMRQAGSRDAAVMACNLALVLVSRSEYAVAETLIDESIQRFTRDGQHIYLGQVNTAMLPCMAARRDWLGWTRHLNAARTCFEHMPVHDDDIAVLAERGALLAEANGEPRHALDAWRLAHQQWQALGRTDAASRTLAAMTRLTAD